MSKIIVSVKTILSRLLICFYETECIFTCLLFLRIELWWYNTILWKSLNPTVQSYHLRFVRENVISLLSSFIIEFLVLFSLYFHKRFRHCFEGNIEGHREKFLFTKKSMRQKCRVLFVETKISVYFLLLFFKNTCICTLFLYTFFVHYCVKRICCFGTNRRLDCNYN